ncbi:restriction endonuclease subunit S [Methylomonas rapida]|uniref:Restriction endonuclease subunit S n=1 Tax=Methylomonas rapida TaxID=2963939 RepID=A0ABY7GJJ7_9GAMM|nr:restriction endonuclease subunit S [Methylomonas rapida]WAR44695.1 restriction endonuclease subunit S [Methylomonas rapida]
MHNPICRGYSAKYGRASFIPEEIHESMKGSRLKAGDILINITGASIGRTCVVPVGFGSANISQHIAFLRIKSWFNVFYISLFLKSPFIKNYIQFEQNGASKEAFNLGQIANIPLLFPPSPEQKAIADYLDEKTAKIDQQIDLLTQKAKHYGELKQALINETVTRGLDKSVPMKDSGIEWIGEIPAYWEVTRNKDIFEERGSLSIFGDETLLTVSHITGVTRRSEKNVNMFMAETMEGYKLCKTGDLIINTMWAWMGALGTAKEDGICSPAYGVYKPNKYKPYSYRYFDYLYRTPNAITEMTRNSKGIVSSRLRLYSKDFFQICTALPTQREQKAIADYLDEKTAQIDAIVEAINAQIEKLKELRKTLINDVVTGKICIL